MKPTSKFPFLCSPKLPIAGAKPSSVISLPLLLVLSLISHFSLAAETTISPGSTLHASNPNQTWSAPSKTFFVQFLSNSFSYSLAVTYDGSVPIWVAGTGASVDSAASLHFLADGDLRLLNGSGSVVWRSNTSNLGVTHATLDDLGNLVLRKNDSSSVWSTFDHPTDAIVPSQNFTTGMALKSGVYSFTLQKTGNLTLMWNNSIKYWTQGLNSTVNESLNNPSIGLLSIGMLSLYDQKLSSSVVMAYSNDYAQSGNLLRFLKLDSDGNLKMYSAQKGSDTVSETWRAVSDQCAVYGYCGNMGVCSYNDTDPICGCPSENFEPIDSSDSHKGCKLKKALTACPDSATMLQMDHTHFLSYPPTNDTFQAGISPCQSNCLVSSICVASTALSDGTGLCTIKVDDFVSAYQSAALPSTSFVKVCAPAEPNSSPVPKDVRKEKRVQTWVVVVVILATLLVLALVEGSVWWWCCRRSRRFGVLASQYALLEYASGAPIQFTYRELQRATKGFKEKLGAGGFGAVYKGILVNRSVIAVKQLEGIEQGEKQFRMEVATISSTHHLNLVRLIGFCSEGRHRLLVYEFMKNGSLDNFLFAAENETGKALSWENRFNIALGTARGITYLHEECRDCIVHCDIKPENILLDESYTAKVSDFGLAKLINPKDHRYRTLVSVRGTRGYLAPEWLANLPITSKSDVYSYGMVLLETVSGRRNFEVSDETNGNKFSNWAFEEFDKGNMTNIVDKRLVSSEMDMDQVRRAVMVSFWCIQEQPSMRPMMGRVVQMLEGVIEIDKPPAPRASMSAGGGNSVLSGTSFTLSGCVSAQTTLTGSAPNPSSTSSYQRARTPSSSVSGMDVEKPTSSLIWSEPGRRGI